MDHEIRLKTFEELTIPAVVPEIPRRQEAFFCPLDLTRSSLDYGLKKMGALKPGESAYLVVPEDLRRIATELAAEFRLPLILLPPEIMIRSPSGSESWAIVAAKGTIYSGPKMEEGK